MVQVAGALFIIQLRLLVLVGSLLFVRSTLDLFLTCIEQQHRGRLCVPAPQSANAVTY
jgi:hypothetical protein